MKALVSAWAITLLSLSACTTPPKPPAEVLKPLPSLPGYVETYRSSQVLLPASLSAKIVSGEGVMTTETSASALPESISVAPRASAPMTEGLSTQSTSTASTTAPAPASPPSLKATTVDLTASLDLWERIRKGFGIPDLEGNLVRDREQWYATRPDYIVRMTERSRKYLFHIVEELERRNMPTELALLPFIESAFNPQAVSSAKAAGMWQFIPSTGKYFELKQNVFRDDRRDVLASTRAALDYLQKLYGMFGDWQLALAAYNWGEGSVQRAIAKNQRAGLGVTYSDLNMPIETRQYIPKLQAIKNIVASPQALNVSLPEIANHPYFQQVPINRDIDVALAAKLAGMSVDDFKALNPSAHRLVILAAGTPQVLLPWDNARQFQQNLDAYGNARLASWTAWIAPTTMKAADVAHRVGMSEADLRNINKVPPRMLVKAGSTLLVPRSERKVEDVSVKVADNAQLSLAPEIVLHKTAVKAKRGDTVATLAARYKVTVSNVVAWNKISTSAHLNPGQALILHLPVKASAPRVTKTATKTATKTTTRSKTHR